MLVTLILVVGGYAIATNRFPTGRNAPNPLAPLFAVTAGAWLVVAGAATGLAGSVLGGENAPAALLLLFVILGVGWMVLGYAATREAANA